MGGGRNLGSKWSGGFKAAVEATSEVFPLQDGFFGQIGRTGKVAEHRQIFSSDPLATYNEFKNLITRGAVSSDETNVTNRASFRFSDGSRVTTRWKSSSASGGSPVVEIWSNDSALAPYQKVHYERID